MNSEQIKNRGHVVAKSNSYKEYSRICRELKCADIKVVVHVIRDRSTKPWGFDSTIYVSNKRELKRAQAVLEGRFQKVYVVSSWIEYEGHGEPLGVFADYKDAEDFVAKRKVDNRCDNFEIYDMPILPLKITRKSTKEAK